jgi:dolichyl-phosphate beta-glucosyltransferase
MNKPFLSIVIPARNEERRLPQTLDQLIRFLERQFYTSEVIVVVNASTDRSLELVESFARDHQAVRCLVEDLPGKGRAVQKGMLAARGAYRLFADADFSMPMEEINRFIPPVLDVAIAIASREAPGAVRYHEPWYRHLTGRVFNTLIRFLVLPYLQDTQCGFKMFRQEAAEDLFPRQTLMGWSFDVELLYLAALRGYPVLEVPIPWYFDPETRVRVLRDSWPMCLDVWRIRQNGRAGRYG